MAKALRKKTWESCYTLLVSKKEKIPSQTTVLLENKHYSCLRPDQGLTVPSLELINLLEAAEVVFQDNIQVLNRKADVAKNIFKCMRQSRFCC